MLDPSLFSVLNDIKFLPYRYTDLVIGPVIVQSSEENRESHESCNPLNFTHSVKETLFNLMPYEGIIRFVLATAVAWPKGALGVWEGYAIVPSVSVPDCLCYFVKKLCICFLSLL